MNHYQLVIGLEVHAQLKTKSKLFSSSPTKYGSEPNTQANVIDLGFPGTLPSLNKEAVLQAIKLGLALGSKINQRCQFDRKNYFYPDLPKGYQITQHFKPILKDGNLVISTGDQEEEQKVIRIHQAHLEEDAGKSIHDKFHNASAIDLNRAGQPLLEIVSEPDLFSIEDAIKYIKTLHHLVVYLDICDGNMQEGSFRCDANISLRKTENAPLGTRVEIKNLNSFKFIEKALHHEYHRQAKVLSSGGSIVQETRLYDESSNTTKTMRGKEDAHDYRYFREPDLPELILSDNAIRTIQDEMPELPNLRKERMKKLFQINETEANILLSNRFLADYYESCLKHNIEPAETYNWLTSILLSFINQASDSIQEGLSKIPALMMASLINKVKQGEISHSAGKTILEELYKNGGTVDEVIEKTGLKQINDDSELKSMIQALIDESPNQVQQLQQGKSKILGYFVGQIMKQSKGKANPVKINAILKEFFPNVE